MRRSALALILAVGAVGARILTAQATSGAPLTLTLEDAISLAHESSPAFLQVENTRRAASAAVTSAYGALLPSLSASFGSSFLQGGQQFFDGTSIGSSSNSVSSQYYLGVSYGVRRI